MVAGKVWVRGPWKAISVAADLDGIVDQLCPAVMSLNLARAREYGQEYCGLIYVGAEGRYYASAPSPLGEAVTLGPTTKKTCWVPLEVRDPRGVVGVESDFHSHPWVGSRISQPDMVAGNQRYSIRIQFDAACRIFKLVPNLDRAVPGELYERINRDWSLVGIIKPEDKVRGFVSPVPQDGRP